MTKEEKLDWFFFTVRDNQPVSLIDLVQKYNKHGLRDDEIFNIRDTLVESGRIFQNRSNLFEIDINSQGFIGYSESFRLESQRNTQTDTQKLIDRRHKIFNITYIIISSVSIIVFGLLNYFDKQEIKQKDKEIQQLTTQIEELKKLVPH